mmetsp:Transcript_21058/g.38963  ORF Transcript_21058/g.38963 Transcript_21058/m.38963 type:complete len:127 (+) Transcript_21058:164-544(+)
MDRVAETIGFNIKLRSIRNQMRFYLAQTQEDFTQQRPILQLPREIPCLQAKPAEYQQSMNDYTPRPGRKLSEIVPGNGMSPCFVCPGCKRTLALSKKYAKEQCQTCYKKEKRLRAEASMATSLYPA